MAGLETLFSTLKSTTGTSRTQDLGCTMQDAVRAQKATQAEGGDDKTAKAKVDASTQALQKNAQDKSMGLCAKYVRTALETGGFTMGRTGSAKDYGPLVEKAGFKPIATHKEGEATSTGGYPVGYTPQNGDIVIFSGTDAHVHGHMAMFFHDGPNGLKDQWISDFRQNNFYPYRGELKGSYTIYRHPDYK